MSRDEPLQGHPRYRKLKSLNRGAFGFVQLAHDNVTDSLVAIKFLEGGSKLGEYVERELINHRLLQHPHIIKFKEVLVTKYHLGIVLEYADGGDCYDYVVRDGHLTEPKARWIFQQLIVAVDYLHRQGVANRDIKLENTLLVGNPDRPLVKLCDFGYAKHQELQSAPDSKVGTPAYLAPEVIMSARGSTYDGKISDVWACGVVLYVMLCGAYPFEREEDRALPPNKRLARMIQRILSVDYMFPEDLRPSESCLDLLSRMLVADPSLRATIEEVMAHPWYLIQLPPGVLDMNKTLKPPVCTQTEEEVIEVVRKAQAIQPDDKETPDRHIDEFLAGRQSA